MYAIIQTGGKQYKVKAGDVVRVEKIEKDLGSEFDLTEVLMVGGDQNYFGKPMVQNAKVTVIVTKQAKAPKVIIFKRRRRQGYRKMRGHRQLYTELFVKAIMSPDGQVSKTDNPAPIFDAKTHEEEKAKKRSAYYHAASSDGVKKPIGKKKVAAKKAVAKKTTAKKTVKKTATKKTKGAAKKKTTKKASK